MEGVDKRPIEGHSGSCRPAQVRVMEGTRGGRILKTEAGTPGEKRKKKTTKTSKLKDGQNRKGTRQKRSAEACVTQPFEGSGRKSTDPRPAENQLCRNAEREQKQSFEYDLKCLFKYM